MLKPTFKSSQVIQNSDLLKTGFSISFHFLNFQRDWNRKEREWVGIMSGRTRSGRNYQTTGKRIEREEERKECNVETKRHKPESRKSVDDFVKMFSDQGILVPPPYLGSLAVFYWTSIKEIRNFSYQKKLKYFIGKMLLIREHQMECAGWSTDIIYKDTNLLCKIIRPFLEEYGLDVLLALFVYSSSNGIISKNLSSFLMWIIVHLAPHKSFKRKKVKKFLHKKNLF